MSLAPAPAVNAFSTAGIDSRSLPNNLFASDSFWTTPLPDDTPLDPNSAKVVVDLKKTAEAQFGSPGKPHVKISTDSYTPTVYVARNSDPLATFRWNDCMGLKSDSGLMTTQLSAIRIPADAVPSPGSDSEMTIYNADTDTYTDIWKAQKNSDRTWSACWGGTIKDASKSDGRFSGRFGTTATGLAFMGGVIRPEELASGEINHVLGICIPYAKPQTELSWPALRGDGQNPLGMNVPAQGQRFRLPADLDIAALNLSPSATAVAKAAQKYGIVVWDTSAAVHFRAVNSLSLKSDPYPALFRNRYSAPEFLGDPARGEGQFPLDKLQLLPMHYQAPQPSPTPSPTPAPSSSPSSTPTPTPTPTPSQSQNRAVHRTAAEGSFTDHLNRTWSGRGSDFEASWFSSMPNQSEITGTPTPRLYMSSAKDVRRISLPETRSGKYIVTLHFIEDYYTKRGERVFHVAAEGRRMWSNLDIFKASGAKGRAYSKSFTVDVTDGHLDITFVPVTQVTTVSAVSVVPKS